MKAVRDPPIGAVEYGCLFPDRPLACQRPLIERQARRDSIDVPAQSRTGDHHRRRAEKPSAVMVDSSNPVTHFASTRSGSPDHMKTDARRRIDWTKVSTHRRSNCPEMSRTDTKV